MAELTDDELLAELGATPEAKSTGGRTHREERVIAGFEDVVRFVEEHGRAPQHGEGRDIFERLYAVRLDRLRALPDWHALLAPMDRHGLLDDQAPAELDDDELLAELGVAPDGSDDIFTLRHVRSSSEVRAAEEVADRKACADFPLFAPAFATIKADLKAGHRKARRYAKSAGITVGEWFIVGGQLAYVAAMEKPAINDYGRTDSRLRVIYDNGTESDVLLRSLQRALHRDTAGRRVTALDSGPLFDGVSGTLYVLRSRSELPAIAALRDGLYKIGFTGGTVEDRIAGAAGQSTYLFADVEVVATYQLFNLQRAKLETLIHRVFAAARLEIEVTDGEGRTVRPQEWFVVSLAAIDEAVRRLGDGSIEHYRYDGATGGLVPADQPATAAVQDLTP